MEHEELTDVLFVQSIWSELEQETEIGSKSDKKESHTDVSETNSSLLETGETVSYISDQSSRRLFTTEIGNIESEKVLKTINYIEMTSDASDFQEGLAEGTWSYTYEEGLLTPEISFDTKMLTPEVSISEDESQAVSDNFENKVTVLFRTDTEETMTSIFTTGSTITDVKTRLAQVFRINITDIELVHETIEYGNSVRLLDLTDKSGFIEFDIRSKKDELLAPGEISLYSPIMYSIIVKVPRDIGEPEKLRILVENQCFVKEWLGGYRNTKTEKEYHHALVQTMPRKRPEGSLPQNTRQTQTPVFPLKDVGDDTGATKATQMWRTDHYIANVYDRIIATNPDNFQSAFPTRQLTFALLIETIVRIKRGFRNFKKLRQKRIDAEEDERCTKINQEIQKTMQSDLLKENENLIVGSTFPVERGDFYLLYQMMGNWWRHNEKVIQKTLTGSARNVALLNLLERETELIWMIEKQRTKVKHEILNKKNIHFLDTCGRPVIFRNNRGFMSSIDTVETQQAREYVEIISSYLNTSETATVEQRLDILCTLKHLLKSYNFPEFDCEIVDLVERECDLIALKLKPSQLKMLRRRIKQLLLHYLHYPIINPALSKYQRTCIPRLDKYHYRCKHCRKLKLSSDYNLHVVLTNFDFCHSCEWMKNIGQQRFNLTPFSRMLNHVRQSELVNCCYASVSYVLQPVGMSYLVNRIWRCKSILSDATDMNRLRMVRFRNDEDWSPWNCILLTVEEAYGHAGVKDVYAFYDQRLINRVHWRHMRAKNHFLPLLLNDRFLQESKMWFDVQDRGKFLFPAHVNKFARTTDFEYIK